MPVLRLNKHNIVRFSLILITAGAIAGCAAIRSDHTAWEGHSSDELRAAWGEPTSIEHIGNDYISYTWADGSCRQSFTALDGIIVGYSEYDCQDK